jgi:hypothetical protein
VEGFRVKLEELARSAAPAVMGFAATEDRNARRLCALGAAVGGVTGAAWIDE